MCHSQLSTLVNLVVVDSPNNVYVLSMVCVAKCEPL